MLLIGIDCATEDKKVGLARATFIDGRVTLERAQVCGAELSAAETVARWLVAEPGRALIAIDAPLGWPVGLAQSLASHHAGVEVATPPNDMFRRHTDRFVQARLGKTPLDVGADRIARTAHAALKLLGRVRQLIGAPVPLAWHGDFSDRVAAIEVYPSATLGSHGLPSVGYKKPRDIAIRHSIIEGLSRRMTIDIDIPVLEEKPDALDAVVCLLAAGDFLTGNVMPPENLELAQKEGWIWAMPRSATKPSGQSPPDA